MGNMVNHTLKIFNSTIHYLKIGKGDHVILAFHGFSEIAAGFEQIREAFGESYSLIAMDFPWHGESKWIENREFGENDLVLFVEAMMGKYGFEKFSVLGFSMGGRLALTLAKRLPERIRQIFLVAPDGIKTAFVFDLAVYPIWGKRIFYMVMKKPGLLFFFVKVLYKYRRISRFMYEFTYNHMDTQEKRDRIYNTWVSLKQFSPSVTEVQKIINQHQLPVHLFFGKTDEVIRPEVGEYFRKNIVHATLDILPKGHKLIHPVLIPYLKKYLNG
jgi:pimeloyl-ACP methyl ester carboxylesterase